MYVVMAEQGRCPVAAELRQQAVLSVQKEIYQLAGLFLLK